MARASIGAGTSAISKGRQRKAKSRGWASPAAMLCLKILLPVGELEIVSADRDALLTILLGSLALVLRRPTLSWRADWD